MNDYVSQRLAARAAPAAAPDLLAALEWIAEIADANYEQDEKLRAQGARTLSRISDKARAAIAKATAHSTAGNDSGAV